MNSTITPLPEKYFIYVRIENTIFGKLRVEQNCVDRFNYFSRECELPRQIKILHQLLRQCTAALRETTSYNIINNGPRNACDRYPCMIEKTPIFNGY